MLNLIDRNEYLENLKKFKEVDLIKVVTGVRRCGKSTLFKLYINYLKSIGIEDNQIISINLEEVENKELHNCKGLHEHVMSRLQKDKMNYIFIDEVQKCDKFEEAVDSLYVKENTDVYITGSNANMLSGELATLLSRKICRNKDVTTFFC
jgi:predicted AAA+ superfamily ATPase